MSIEVNQGSINHYAADYEFDALQNVVIDQLAARMKYLGYGTVAFIVGQAVLAVAIVARDPSMLVRVMITSLFTGGFAALMLSASRSFSKITKTQGEDISHLLNALGKLSTVYAVQSVLVTIAAGLMGISALLMIAAR